MTMPGERRRSDDGAFDTPMPSLKSAQARDGPGFLLLSSIFRRKPQKAQHISTLAPPAAAKMSISGTPLRFDDDIDADRPKPASRLRHVSLGHRAAVLHARQEPCYFEEDGHAGARRRCGLNTKCHLM